MILVYTICFHIFKILVLFFQTMSVDGYLPQTRRYEKGDGSPLPAGGDDGVRLPFPTFVIGNPSWICSDESPLPTGGDDDKCVFGLNHKDKKKLPTPFTLEGKPRS